VPGSSKLDLIRAEGGSDEKNLMRLFVPAQLSAGRRRTRRGGAKRLVSRKLEWRRACPPWHRHGRHAGARIDRAEWKAGNVLMEVAGCRRWKWLILSGDMGELCAGEAAHEKR